MLEGNLDEEKPMFIDSLGTALRSPRENAFKMEDFLLLVEQAKCERNVKEIDVLRVML